MKGKLFAESKRYSPDINLVVCLFFFPKCPIIKNSGKLKSLEKKMLNFEVVGGKFCSVL